MRLIYQIPRNSLAWLLAAHALVVIPHIPILPMTIVAAAWLCLIWRIQVYRGLWKFPARYIKYCLAGINLIAIYLGYGRLIGLEPMVALLVAGFSLKLIEMHQRRDALTVIYLAYLVAAIQLLFSQTMMATLAVIGQFVIITTALIGLNQSQGYRYPLKSLGTASLLLLQAIPLMVVLFLLMPRLGALWSVPSPQHSAKTGVSDNMSPGEISQLANNADLAFRVSFEDGIPDHAKRYWRGLVFSRFDGRRWSSAEPYDYARDRKIVRWQGEGRLPWEDLLKVRGKKVNYSIIMEPSHQPWLYAMELPVSSERGVGLAREFRLISKTPVTQRMQYQVSSYTDYRFEQQRLPVWRYRNETRLPRGYNPKTKALAEKWYRESGSVGNYISRVLSWFNSEFTYTYNPPRLGKHTADEFLFDTRQGFCEHFASSFAIMMRAAGIPARVVAGYQGGEQNPYQNYLLIHQYDAHAWTEVWLEGKGWRRIDPTASVAPERIQRGLRDMLGAQDFLADSPLSLAKYRNIRWLNLLRLQLDRMDYMWHKNILAFDRKRQYELLTRLLGQVEPARVALVLLVTTFLLLCAVGLFLAKSRRQQERKPKALRAYLRYCRILGKMGFVRKPHETPTEFAARVIRVRPDLKQPVAEITGHFERFCYAGKGDDKKLCQSVARFRPARMDRSNR